jgi:tRNA(Arg) A34 adenosine deaminase TadA
MESFHSVSSRLLFFFVVALLTVCSCVLCMGACVCVLLDRGRLTTSDEDSEWAMDPLHISQLKELYRRDRAKNKRGNVSRKFKIVQYRTNERTTAAVAVTLNKNLFRLPVEDETKE